MEKSETQNAQPAAPVATATETQENGVQQPILVAAPGADAPTETKQVENGTETLPQPPAAKADEAQQKEVSTGEEAQTAAAVQDKAEEPPVDNRPEYLIKNPALAEFFEHLPTILEKTGHNEMWGVPLKDSDHVPTVNTLIKFLRANEGNVRTAEEQLTKALEWRKTMDPLSIVENMQFPSSKYKNLGYVTTYSDEQDAKSIWTWNIYGAVKNIDATFGDLDEFIKWRVALMELSVRELNLAEATTVIDYNGEDPYQMYQVHDYQNVSFLRMSPTVRNASRETISVFSMAYPELLREKFFVNVPVVMGWVFTALKVFLSKNTIRKFHPITNGVNLARENKAIGGSMPKSYGGNGPELAYGATTVSLVDDTPEPEATEPQPAENAVENPAPENAKKDEPQVEAAPTTSAEPAKPVENTEQPATAAKPEETAPATK
ncbi:Non-classical phosphatidylinositol transfer protein (PITP) [Myotisia sp. PD_48]|nr:Non-classical phosphatidylinositol transfer protein (PITP) [Myotisia sp. PD_48]